MTDPAAVFKALADPTRRLLLDRLRERNGQSLGELCEHLAMARQSVTQHLDLLTQANLITVVRQGRQRLHYLNPVPIQEIQERWIAGFERPRLDLLSAVKRQAEESAMSSVPTYAYTTYIRATAEQVWQALTDATSPRDTGAMPTSRTGSPARPGNTAGPTDPEWWTSSARFSRPNLPPAWS